MVHARREGRRVNALRRCTQCHTLILDDLAQDGKLLTRDSLLHTDAECIAIQGRPTTQLSRCRACRPAQAPARPPAPSEAAAAAPPAIHAEPEEEPQAAEVDLPIGASSEETPSPPWRRPRPSFAAELAMGSPTAWAGAAAALQREARWAAEPPRLWLDNACTLSKGEAKGAWRRHLAETAAEHQAESQELYLLANPASGSAGPRDHSAISDA